MRNAIRDDLLHLKKYTWTSVVGKKPGLKQNFNVTRSILSSIYLLLYFWNFNFPMNPHVRMFNYKPISLYLVFHEWNPGLKKNDKPRIVKPLVRKVIRSEKIV